MVYQNHRFLLRFFFLLVFTIFIIYLFHYSTFEIIPKHNTAILKPIEKSPTSKLENLHKNTIAVVVMACNRKSVKNCLDSIMESHKSSERLVFYFSHGCSNKEVRNVHSNYSEKFSYLSFPEYSPSSKNELIPLNYAKLSYHYKLMFTFIFDSLKHGKAIIIEDDLSLSPDFFDFFLNMEPLLDDPTVFCISSWNDNGYKEYAHNPHSFMRTNFFPGLGWMLKRSIWDEIKAKWPEYYWDDWMRSADIIKSRTCIVPEISRVSNFGINGVSGPTFYGIYVKPIIKNEKLVDYSQIKITDLLPKNYDEVFFKAFFAAKLINLSEYIRIRNSRQKYDVKIPFSTVREFSIIADTFRIIPSPTHDIYRVSYYGIVKLSLQDHTVYIFSKNYKYPLLQDN